jgi:hypothetical protein
VPRTKLRSVTASVAARDGMKIKLEEVEWAV